MTSPNSGSHVVKVAPRAMHLSAVDWRRPSQAINGEKPPDVRLMSPERDDERSNRAISTLFGCFSSRFKNRKTDPRVACEPLCLPHQFSHVISPPSIPPSCFAASSRPSHVHVHATPTAPALLDERPLPTSFLRSFPLFHPSFITDCVTSTFSSYISTFSSLFYCHCLPTSVRCPTPLPSLRIQYFGFAQALLELHGDD